MKKHIFSLFLLFVCTNCFCQTYEELYKQLKITDNSIGLCSLDLTSKDFVNSLTAACSKEKDVEVLIAEEADSESMGLFRYNQLIDNINCNVGISFLNSGVKPFVSVFFAGTDISFLECFNYFSQILSSQGEIVERQEQLHNLIVKNKAGNYFYLRFYGVDAEIPLVLNVIDKTFQENLKDLIEELDFSAMGGESEAEEAVPEEGEALEAIPEEEETIEINIDVDSPFELATGILQKKYPGTLLTVSEALLETINNDKDNKIEAAFLLGKIYAGEGDELWTLDGEIYNGDVKTDASKAVQYLEMSASKHYLPAMEYLGRLYLHGNDVVNRNTSRGFAYLEGAEKAGSKDVYEELANCYEKGIGVTKFLAAAGMYYEKAGLASKHPEAYAAYKAKSAQIAAEEKAKEDSVKRVANAPAQRIMVKTIPPSMNGPIDGWKSSYIIGEHNKGTVRLNVDNQGRFFFTFYSIENEKVVSRFRGRFQLLLRIGTTKEDSYVITLTSSYSDISRLKHFEDTYDVTIYFPVPQNWYQKLKKSYKVLKLRLDKNGSYKDMEPPTGISTLSSQEESLKESFIRHTNNRTDF